MDFASLYSDTHTVEIFDPSGEEVFITIELRSSASDEVKAVDRRINTTAMKKGRNLKGSDQEKLGVDRLCALVASWKWKEGLTFEGKEPDNTETFKRHVFESNSQASVAIVNRINEALADQDAFTKA